MIVEVLLEQRLLISVSFLKSGDPKNFVSRDGAGRDWSAVCEVRSVASIFEFDLKQKLRVEGVSM